MENFSSIKFSTIVQFFLHGVVRRVIASNAAFATSPATWSAMRTELDNCGKFLSTEKIFHAVQRVFRMRTEPGFCENLVPKSPTSSFLYPPPPSFLYNRFRQT